MMGRGNINNNPFHRGSLYKMDHIRVTCSQQQSTKVEALHWKTLPFGGIWVVYFSTVLKSFFQLETLIYSWKMSAVQAVGSCFSSTTILF